MLLRDILFLFFCSHSHMNRNKINKNKTNLLTKNKINGSRFNAINISRKHVT